MSRHRAGFCPPGAPQPGLRRSRCALTALAMVLVAILVLVGCSVPSDDEAQPIDPARLEATTPAKRACGLPGVDGAGSSIDAYLVSQQSDPPFVAPVVRIVERTTSPTPFDALEALFECIVTQDERRAGLASAIPEETRLLGVRPINPDSGVFEVQLGPLRNRGGQRADDLDKLAVAQIFFTATSPGLGGEVRELKFVIDGRAVAVNTDRRTVGQNDTVRREDFVASSPTSVTTRPPATTAVPAPTSIAPAPTR